MESTAPAETPRPALSIAPGPHIHDPSLTTRRMMLDVILALLPLIAVSVWVFGGRSLVQIAICTVFAMIAEALFCAFRKRRAPLGDLSAVVTGLILALSLPASAPWYIGAVGAVTGIGLGKSVFGGLGNNTFNPAMVGRAFAMMAFPMAMGATAYVIPNCTIDVLTQATPLTRLKMAGETTALWPLFLGTTNGSIGETSALASLLGGVYLCLRRTASWEIPAGAIGMVTLIAGIQNLVHPNAAWTVWHTLSGGALLFGAFFIATDPVSSPLTPKGKFIFGAGFGAMVLMFRAWSGYPEGVMFAILIMNGLAPLINRGSIPTPIGGPVPNRKAA